MNKESIWPITWGKRVNGRRVPAGRDRECVVKKWKNGERVARTLHCDLCGADRVAYTGSSDANGKIDRENGDRRRGRRIYCADCGKFRLAQPDAMNGKYAF